jgi:Fe-S cluster assembly protein SufD
MLPAAGPLQSYHRHAWEVYSHLGIPTPAEEAWRRTSLQDLPAADFRLTQDTAGTQNLPSIPAGLLHTLNADQLAGQLALTPREAQGYLDPALEKTGVVFCDLRTAEQTHPDLVQRLAGEIIRPEEGKFAALAGAFSETGAVVYIPPHLKIDRPLHSVLWGPGEHLAHVTHLMVFLDEGASATFIFEEASPENVKEAMHVGILEVRVATEASLRLIELQSWGHNVWNFNHERIQAERNASVDWIFGAVGSHLTKNFSELNLVEEGATGRMTGFYFADGTQHFDHDTQQNHRAPHTTSDLLFKGALKGHSRSIWQGMIYVAPGAEKADGYQANRNLVLSHDARADSIPGLEILADDVRCTHGATVGQLDEEPLFYLLARGIPRPDAERLLVEGFFDPVLQRIPDLGVRNRLQLVIQEKMDRS